MSQYKDDITAKDLKRQEDPEYSLDQAKIEYITSVNRLKTFVDAHATSGMRDPARFVFDLQRKAADVRHALAVVHDDIDRVSEKNNPGWLLPGKRVPYRTRRPMFSNYTESDDVPVEDE